jgi:ParB-like chromosome segregation protein Spo0J
MPADPDRRRGDHQRPRCLWEVARAQGVSEVSCIVIDHLDKAELRSLSIALNRLGETGAWDPDALRLEFEELTVLGVDLVVTGFETAEIDGLMLLDDDEDLAAGEAPPPQPLETAVSSLGDIWLLAITVWDMATPATPLSITG